MFECVIENGWTQMKLGNINIELISPLILSEITRRFINSNKIQRLDINRKLINLKVICPQ